MLFISSHPFIVFITIIYHSRKYLVQKSSANRHVFTSLQHLDLFLRSDLQFMLLWPSYCTSIFWSQAEAINIYIKPLLHPALKAFACHHCRSWCWCFLGMLYVTILTPVRSLAIWGVFDEYYSFVCRPSPPPHLITRKSPGESTVPLNQINKPLARNEWASEWRLETEPASLHSHKWVIIAISQSIARADPMMTDILFAFQLSGDVGSNCLVSQGTASPQKPAVPIDLRA